METVLPDREILYQALIDRDSRYEGIFLVAVKTTGIFCRPTCAAKKPRAENVEFFGTAREALLRGYRPCKRCTPLVPRGGHPPWLAPLMEEVAREEAPRFTEAMLRERGLEPGRVRRWFQEHHGLTFQAYLRALRLGRAFGQIRQGEKVVNAAWDAGYGSLSGFTDSFRKTLGGAPGSSRTARVVAVSRILSPLGPLVAGATEGGVCLLEFADRRMLETQLARVAQRLDARCLPGGHPLFPVLERQLAEYFAGERRDFDVPLLLAGTPFQERVWAALRTIPYGATRSYQEQARLLGAPDSVRAVARANGDNRIAILVPCHRVVGKDGHLTGYGGGLWRKRHLLDLETRGR